MRSRGALHPGVDAPLGSSIDSGPAPADAEPAPSPPSFDQVAEAFRPLARRIFARFRVPSADAEDVLQDVLLLAFRKWSRLDHPLGWLSVALSYRCLTYWRLRRHHPLQLVSSELLASLAPPLPPPQERADLFLDLDSLAEAALSPRLREILTLRREGYGPQEIAQLVGVNATSVRQLHSRALKRVLLRLADSGPRP